MSKVAERSKGIERTVSEESISPNRSLSRQSRAARSKTNPSGRAGNQTLQRLLRSSSEALVVDAAATASVRFNHDFSRTPLRSPAREKVQQKPATNLPADSYQQEVHGVAEQVTRMPEFEGFETPTNSPANRATHDRISSLPESAEDLQAVTASLKPSRAGRPLSQAERQFFEPRFGTDFSQVRIHSNAQAAEVADAMNALAFTQGEEIHFAAGQYDSGSRRGMTILGHELAHVVQQRQGRVYPNEVVAGQPVNSEKTLEQEADTMTHEAIGNGALGETSVTRHANSSSPRTQSNVIQKWDVHGRLWLHDTGYTTPFGDERYDQHHTFMFRFNVLNLTIPQWQTALATGDRNFKQNLLGFLLFAVRPDLAGCDAETMASFLEPYFSRGRRHRGEIVSEARGRGLGGSLIVAALGGDISGERIENYWNRAQAPSADQIINFVAAIMANSQEMDLPEYGILDSLGEASTYWELFEDQFADYAIRTLVNRYYTQALVRISNTPALRSLSQSGTEYLAEYGDSGMRARMMAESGATAMKALDVLATNAQGAEGESARNNAYTLITNAGTSMQAILQAQLDVDRRAQRLVDSVFNNVWGLIPGGGALGSAAKAALKTSLSNALRSMVQGDNMERKILIFREEFNRQARNLVDTTPMTSEQAATAVSSLFSASASVD